MTVYYIFFEEIRNSIETNKFDESQAGFRASYSAIDNVFSLQANREFFFEDGVDVARSQGVKDLISSP